MATSLQEWAEWRWKLVQESHGPLAPFPGGKYRYASAIVDRFPFQERKFNLLLIAFGGMLSVLCATPRSFSHREVVIELTKAHVNFLEVLQDNEVREEGLAGLCSEMLSYLEPIPMTSEDFYEFLCEKFKDEAEWNKLPKSKRAAWWYLLNWWRFPSTWKGLGFRDSGTYASVLRYKPQESKLTKHGQFSTEDLKWFSQRLWDTQFLNANSLKLLPNYLGDENTFCFLDPPYPGGRKYMGQGAPSLEFYAELINLLPTTRDRVKEGKAWWLMTLKPTPEIGDMISERFGSDLYVDELGSRWAIGSKSDAPSGELVYANYDASPRTEWRHYEPQDPLQQQLTFEKV
jgi:site-specific DNA-adenine methylase